MGGFLFEELKKGAAFGEPQRHQPAFDKSDVTGQVNEK
jgi:hypothetical protein